MSFSFSFRSAADRVFDTAQAEAEKLSGEVRQVHAEHLDAAARAAGQIAARIVRPGDEAAVTLSGHVNEDGSSSQVRVSVDSVAPVADEEPAPGD